MSVALVTGGTGCIGAVTVRDLLAGGIERVVIGSRTSDRDTLRLWLDDQQLRRLDFAFLDLGDPDNVAEVVRQSAPTHIVHLAALQSPDCDADPARGLVVNLAGTQQLLEACERQQPRPQRFVFASSAAVYGPRAMYPGPSVREDDPLAPPNRYGIWKLAGEELCRLFSARTGVPTVCLRLNTTYGPGRDRGLTSAATTAMKHVAAGRPFEMPYRGRENYHYVEDVGAHFAAAALESFDGFGAFNIRGTTIEVREFLDTVHRVATGLDLPCELGIADDATANLFVSDLDDSTVQAKFRGVPCTPLATGIERSLRRFVAIAKGEA